MNLLIKNFELHFNEEEMYWPDEIGSKIHFESTQVESWFCYLREEAEPCPCGTKWAANWPSDPDEWKEQLRSCGLMLLLGFGSQLTLRWSAEEGRIGRWWPQLHFLHHPHRILPLPCSKTLPRDR